MVLGLYQDCACARRCCMSMASAAQQQVFWADTAMNPVPPWSAGAVMPVSFVLTGRVINSVGTNPFDTQRLIDQVDQVSATCVQPTSASCITDYA